MIIAVIMTLTKSQRSDELGHKMTCVGWGLRSPSSSTLFIHSLIYSQSPQYY